MEKEIGTVTLNYNTAGVFTDGSFAPAGISLDSEEITKRFVETTGKNYDLVLLRSHQILSAWFSQTNHIELADRDLYEITTERAECEYHRADVIKKCTIRFLLTRKNNEETT